MLERDPRALPLPESLTDDERARFEALVERRVSAATPVAHLVGRRGFWDLELISDGRALVPRPETETLVEALEEQLVAGTLPPGPLVDWGTGSGALALVLARHRPVVALDRARDALALASANRARITTSHPVLLVRADGLSAMGSGSAAAIVANPPYVTRREWGELMPDVRDHDPVSALVPEDGDVVGLYARLGREAFAVLRPGGLLLCEIGAGQADRLEAALAEGGLEPRSRHRDLAGIERVLVARRPQGPPPDRPGARGAQPASWST